MDNRLFDFVRQFSEELADLADRIENQMFDQPHGAMVQARLYCEELVKKISQAEGFQVPYEIKHAERIYRLYRQDFISEEVYLKLEWMRKIGNKAAHNVEDIEIKDILEAHNVIFELSVWYMEVYVSHQFIAPEYKLPIKNSQEANSIDIKDLDELIKPYISQTMDELREEFQQQLAAIKEETQNNRAFQQTSRNHSEIADNKGNDKKKKTPLDSEEALPLSKEKEDLLSIFTKNNFVKTYETKKAIEFEHTINHEVIYLLGNRETSIVLHPGTVEQYDDLKNMGKTRSSTALKQFPKEINKGQNPIQYGYLFTCKTESELDLLLNRLNDLIKSN